MRRLLALLMLLLAVPAVGLASDAEKPVARHYAVAPPAPATQTADEASAKSAGCLSCHKASDAASMHKSDAVVLGCADCHGGDATIALADRTLKPDDPAYRATLSRAHVLPRYPKAWNWPSSANPRASYTLLNKESPEFIRFVNPSDYRVVRESCGACHMDTIQAAERSIMASGAMLWGGASYNNGIVPFKNYVFGEAYTRDGEPAKIVSPGDPPGTVTPEQRARGALPALYPLPSWHVVPPADIFRVFERGGRNINTGFAEIGLPNSTGSIQRLEEPGRPDLKQSNRGPGTGLRVAIPVLNIHKTRLNDPFTWFLGTNDQPGDYRSSGCASCHVVYANDREPRHSSIWAQYGRDGQTATVDPTIKDKLEGQPDHHDVFGDVAVHGDSHREPGQKEKGHPVEHAFTRAIPTSQCMTCHMHQPNIFLNSFLGYTMWDYESDAAEDVARQAEIPDSGGRCAADVQRAQSRNGGELHAANGAISAFLRNVYDLNKDLKDTQFADYHGHGWNFRGRCSSVTARAICSMLTARL